MRPTINVVRSGERQYSATFEANGKYHRSEAATMEEAVGKLVCDHVDLLEIVVTMQDTATNPRAQAIPLEPSCWCDL